MIWRVSLSMKKFYSILALVFSVFLLLQVPVVISGDVSKSERMLVFMEDVVQLDLAKYNVTLITGSSDIRSDLGGLLEENFKYILESSESSLGVLFKFINNTITRCRMNVYEGSPLYVQSPPAGVLEMSDGFLQEYQSFVESQKSSVDLSLMRDMLKMVDTSEDTLTVGNIKLEVKNSSLDWIYTFNGMELHALGLSFKNGHLSAFSDDRNLFKIGSSEVKVSKEDALLAALNYAEDYSWKVSTDNGWKEVTDFKIVEDSATAELQSYPKEDPSTLFPYWYIILPLDKVYLGTVNRIQVGVWADSGEIIFCQVLGTGLVCSTDSSTTISDGDSVIGDLTPFLIAVFLVLTVALAIAIYARKTEREIH